jgi:deazaflavin-dependent oxidoreductase (nitroreductase family)
MSTRYIKPDWFNKHVFDPAVAAMTRLGISVWGSRMLRVRGRKSGEWRSSPVNMLPFKGARYLVAPRGETHWVRNIRASGEGELVVGGRVEPFRAVEIPDDQKLPILREYLRRWKFEVGQFFGGVGADSPESELRRIAPEHPVFRIEPKAG